jgi:hypothetical protein
MLVLPAPRAFRPRKRLPLARLGLCSRRRGRRSATGAAAAREIELGREQRLVQLPGVGRLHLARAQPGRGTGERRLRGVECGEERGRVDHAVLDGRARGARVDVHDVAPARVRPGVEGEARLVGGQDGAELVDGALDVGAEDEGLR